MNKIHSVLILGQDGGQTKQRLHALEKIGCEVGFVKESADEHLPGVNYHPSFVDRVLHKLGFPRDRHQVNKKLLLELNKKAYQLLWVEKSLTLKSKALRKIKKLYPDLKIAWYSADDMFAKHNQSYYFVRSVPLYDVIFTTKTYNCDQAELPSLGARCVIFVGKSFDKSLCTPVRVSEGDCRKLSTEVGFVGTFEHDRAEKMLFLAKHGVSVRIFGNGWGAYVHKHPKLIVENKPVYGEDYQKIISLTKINLCFLRKINRDQQTSRSVEIPAMGAFMLAERTNEHLELFVEGKEADFFDINNPRELLEKIQYYLAHEDERKKIAVAGRERCLRSDYSHEARWRFMLDQVSQLGATDEYC